MLGIYYDEIVLPARGSTIVKCYENGEDYVRDKYNFEVSGFAIAIPDDVDMNNIKSYDITGDINPNPESFKCVISVDPENKRTIRHELCHCNQFEENRYSDCNNQEQVYKNEVECYVKENFFWINTNISE